MFQNVWHERKKTSSQEKRIEESEQEKDRGRRESERARERVWNRELEGGAGSFRRGKNTEKDLTIFVAQLLKTTDVLIYHTFVHSTLDFNNIAQYVKCHNLNYSLKEMNLNT